MTLNYGIFDVSDPQNPDREYSAALLSRILSKHIRDGIVHGDGGELAVSPSDPPAMTVEVATGTAMVQGRFCENDAVLTLAVPAADTTYPRIDRVVVRLSVTPGRTIDILVKKGTPAPSPVPPGLTRTPETWELSLAQIFVAAGAKMVQAANITDERGNASLCGVAAPAYVPSSQVEVVGAVDMQGKALTGLPAPSGATDAARKGYVDEVIGGFGISQIAIDADKNWNGKRITNVGGLEINDAKNFIRKTRALVTVGTGTDILKKVETSGTGYGGTGWYSIGTFTFSQYLSGTGQITCTVTTAHGYGAVRILKAGSVVASGVGDHTISGNAGDVLDLQYNRDWSESVLKVYECTFVCKGTVTYNMNPAPGKGKYVPIVEEVFTPEDISPNIVW